MEFFSKVESTFSIAGRGIVIVPEEPKGDFRIRIGTQVQLRSPNGQTRETHITGVELLSGRKDAGSKFSRTAILVTRDIAKEDVLVGSEIWYTREDVSEGHLPQTRNKSRRDV
jgi:translation elongation factor EF-Tu-like GTPase